MKVFVARQPIVDARQRVTSYELRFRAGGENVLAYLNADYPAQAVMSHALHVFGFGELVHGKRAFVPFTRSLLVQQAALLLPPDAVVVDVREPIPLDVETFHACEVLKQGGYMLAMGDFVAQPDYAPLLPMVDIVRIDFAATTSFVRRALTERLSRWPVKLLADRVATRQDFAAGMRGGYEYFQGDFLWQAEIIARDDLPISKINGLRFLRAINQPGIDFDHLEQLIKQDVVLSVKLLRYINSAWFSLSHRVTSIRHALVLLGANVVRRWASLVTVTSLGYDRPPELIATCLQRACFCERLGSLLDPGGSESDLFLVGLFSSLEALVGRPLPEILAEVAVPNEVREALLGTPNRLSQAYDLVLAYERGDWPSVALLALALKIDPEQLPKMYEQTIRWVDEAMTG